MGFSVAWQLYLMVMEAISAALEAVILKKDGVYPSKLKVREDAVIKPLVTS